MYAEEHPFDDMHFHWASNTSYSMFRNGLMLGEISEQGSRVFNPSRNMSVAEFLTVFARLLKKEIPDIFKTFETENDALNKNNPMDFKVILAGVLVILFVKQKLEL